MRTLALTPSAAAEPADVVLTRLLVQLADVIEFETTRSGDWVRAASLMGALRLAGVAS